MQGSSGAYGEGLQYRTVMNVISWLKNFIPMRRHLWLKTVLVAFIVYGLNVFSAVWKRKSVLSMALQSFYWTLAAFSVSWSYTQSVGLLGQGISRSQVRYLNTEQHKNRINAYTDIHDSSGIRIQDSSIRAGEDRAANVIDRKRKYLYNLGVSHDRFWLSALLT
jgi:hypothetical protein